MMAPDLPDQRQSFQEALELLPLPPDGETRRYIGIRAAWIPGSDLDGLEDIAGRGAPIAYVPTAAFGGHVYAQAGLAVCRAIQDTERVNGVAAGGKRLGLHTIHGYFTSPGLPDRPFIHEVSFISQGRGFTTCRVNARQPLQPSTTPDRFPESDASRPLGPICFTAIVSFKIPQPHSGGVSTQEASVQSRFAGILDSRHPRDWPPAPSIDLDLLVPRIGPDIVGTFPIVDMKKVDLRAWNAGRPVHARRELILYRLLRPLPAQYADGGSGEWGANAHVLAHAFEADRNGLLMTANHLGFLCAGAVASLSYSFLVHCNVDHAIMEPSDDQWWVQEWSVPRSGAGRATIESKIWSPAGLHVATMYQDGICTAQDEAKGKGKL